MKILFLHGLGQTSASWNKTIFSLAKTNTIYNPNVLDWVKYQPTTYQNIFRGLERYVSSFSEPVGLCGLSLGAALLSDAQIKEIDQAGHEINVTHPKELAKLLNDFFKHEMKNK